MTQQKPTVDELVDAYASLAANLEHEKTSRNAAQDLIVDLQDDAFKSGLIAAAKHIVEYVEVASRLLALMGDHEAAYNIAEVAAKVRETQAEFERGEFNIGRPE